jgi:WD40 repeat protein
MAPASVMTVAFSPDGRRVLAGGLNYTVGLWEVDTGKELKRFESAGADRYAPVNCLAFSPDGRRALSAHGGYVGKRPDHTVRLWGLPK